MQNTHRCIISKIKDNTLTRSLFSGNITTDLNINLNDSNRKRSQIHNNLKETLVNNTHTHDNADHLENSITLFSNSNNYQYHQPTIIPTNTNHKITDANST